jgi:23S rRNA maturation mini-RNase III
MNNQEMQIMQTGDALLELQAIDALLVELNNQIHDAVIDLAARKSEAIKVQAELTNLKEKKKMYIQRQNNLKAIIKAG